MNDEQRERDKVSAQAYYDRQQKKLKEAKSTGSGKVEHYEEKVKQTEKEFRREYQEYPSDNSSGGCSIS